MSCPETLYTVQACHSKSSLFVNDLFICSGRGKRGTNNFGREVSCKIARYWIMGS